MMKTVLLRSLTSALFLPTILGGVATLLLTAFLPRAGRAQASQTINTQSVTLRTLHTFPSPTKFGAVPVGALVLSTDGSFYGTTGTGGSRGYGTIYKITPDGQFTTLFAFNKTNGAYPNALMQATDGNFYGTTSNGGVSGRGTIFRFGSNGVLKTLHSFLADNSGFGPLAGLTQGADGALYGTTPAHSAADHGTLFRITPAGAYSVAHAFLSGDAIYSQAQMTLASDGSLYGVSSSGGAFVKGAIFRLRPNGTYSYLHTFDGRYGAFPQSRLTEGSDGYLYGATAGGGPVTDDTHKNGYGTLFKISKTGQFTTLHAFGPDKHGASPQASFVEGVDGNFYGTTHEGGFDPQTGKGTVFQMTPDGTVTTLYKFDGGVHGSSPLAGLTVGLDGKLYGVTPLGGVVDGAAGHGTIFKLTLP